MPDALLCAMVAHRLGDVHGQIVYRFLRFRERQNHGTHPIMLLCLDVLRLLL